METNELGAVLERLKHYGGNSDILKASEKEALLQLSSGDIVGDYGIPAEEMGHGAH